MNMDLDMSKICRKVYGEVYTGLQRQSVQMSNSMRNAALEVLRGQRTGRRYRIPFSVGKNGTKVRSRTWYTASAPGEPPAVRTGALRLSWRIVPKQQTGGHINPGIETAIPYAEALENGTTRMDPRPYRQRIIERSMPGVRMILKRTLLDSNFNGGGT